MMWFIVFGVGLILGVVIATLVFLAGQAAEPPDEVHERGTLATQCQDHFQDEDRQAAA